MTRRLVIIFLVLAIAFSTAPIASQAAIPSNYKVRFSIKGKGHGVGMSMAGVYGMATHNKSYSDIVNYYYPNTKWTATNDNEKISVQCEDGVRRTYAVKEYLYRLAEEPDTWPKEGLRTLMVSARTYLRYKISKYGYMPGGQNFIHTIKPSARPNIVAAVNDTAGKIKTYNGSPILAAFSASAGGYTASFVDTWPGGSTSYPYLTRIASPYDKYIPSSWLYTKNITIGTIEKAFSNVGHINNIRVIKRNGRGSWGGRVLKVRIYGSSKTRDIQGWNFASALGLNSSIFTFTIRPVINIKASRRTVRRGKALTVYGFLYPKHNGLVVRTYIYKGKKKYIRRAKLYGNSTEKSKYKWKFRPKTRGLYRLKTKFGGDSDHLSSTSSIIIIKVI